MDLGFADRIVVVTGASKGIGLKRMQAKIPFGRLGTPEEVAQVALFLASVSATTRRIPNVD